MLIERRAFLQGALATPVLTSIASTPVSSMEIIPLEPMAPYSADVPDVVMTINDYKVRVLRAMMIRIGHDDGETWT